MREQANESGRSAEERLEELYGELAELIPEALAEDFVGMGYAKGRYYDGAETRILAVEKIPRPDKMESLGHAHGGASQKEDEKDFTGVTARIVHSLLGAKGTDWPDHVAWSYLYKLAPRRGKPDDVIYGKQKALCEEIIKLEIETLKPTHVLFFTGWGSVWDFDLPLAPLLKGDAVEAWGVAENGARLIVTRYAVRRPEEKFALDIVEKMKQLDGFAQEERGIY